MDRPLRPLGVVVADGLGHHHVGADGQAHEKIYQQVHQRACGGHCRQGGVAGVAAHHNDVSGVKEELEDAGEHQGQGKGQNFWPQGAIAHVDLVTLGSHIKTSFLSA